MGTFDMPTVSTKDRCVGLLVLSVKEAQATTRISEVILSIALLGAHSTINNERVRTVIIDLDTNE